MNQRQQEQEQYGLSEEIHVFLIACNNYVVLQNKKLDVFELDGSINGTCSGEKKIKQMIDLFIEHEMYEECAYLHQLRNELIERTRKYKEQQRQAGEPTIQSAA